MIFAPRSHNVGNLGTPLKFGWNRGGVALLRKPAIFLKWGKIGQRLRLMTNRKFTCFRLVQNSTTLDDLEGPLSFKTGASFGAHHENLNDDIDYTVRDDDVAQ